MSLAKKIILCVLSFVTIAVAGVTVYGVKVYKDAEKSLDKTYVPVSKSVSKTNSEALKATKPISILLMGIDTGAVGREETWDGRSDSMMVVTVNPVKKTTTVVSLERDILVDIIGPADNKYNGIDDKLNHSYSYGGEDMTIATIEQLLDIKLNYFAKVNMQGLSDLIDAVGGIDVNNKLGEFTVEDGPYGSTTVPAGKIHLNGETGLAYARMRHEDPTGDIGRQKRQREVVELIARKLLSVDGFSQYQKVLKAIEKNMKTNIPLNDIKLLAQSYRDAFDKVENVQLQGIGTEISGVSFQILPQAELLEVQNIIKTQLDLPTSEYLNGNQITYESQYGYSPDGSTGYTTTDDSTSLATADGYDTTPTNYDNNEDE
ncbi:MAG: LCP family protein [Lactobacillales bacterium]|jgi:LCP family protein required for cell wall assembly|nr:LCP family protein [Lactobacillales bacterium]